MCIYVSVCTHAHIRDTDTHAHPPPTYLFVKKQQHIMYLGS